jgi:hypothetical protein
MDGRGWREGLRLAHRSLDGFWRLIRRPTAPKHLMGASHLTCDALHGLRRDSRTAAVSHPLSSIKINNDGMVRGSQASSANPEPVAATATAICRGCRGAEGLLESCASIPTLHLILRRGSQQHQDLAG